MSVSTNDRWMKAVRWLLALGYGVGAPLTAVIEARGALISQRFDLPPSVVFAACLVQLVSVPALFGRRTAFWAAVALSVVTVGAVGAHLRIGSPWTSLTAVFFTGLQLWFARRTMADAGRTSP